MDTLQSPFIEGSLYTHTCICTFQSCFPHTWGMLYYGGFAKPLYRRGFAIGALQNHFRVGASYTHTYTHMHISVFFCRYGDALLWRLHNAPLIEGALLWGPAKLLHKRGFTIDSSQSPLIQGMLQSPSIEELHYRGSVKPLYTRGFVKHLYRRGFAKDLQRGGFIHTYAHFSLFPTDMGGCFNMEALRSPSIEGSLLWRLCKALYRRDFTMEASQSTCIEGAL